MTAMSKALGAVVVGVTLLGQTGASQVPPRSQFLAARASEQVSFVQTRSIKDVKDVSGDLKDAEEAAAEADKAVGMETAETKVAETDDGTEVHVKSLDEVNDAAAEAAVVLKVDDMNKAEVNSAVDEANKALDSDASDAAEAEEAQEAEQDLDDKAMATPALVHDDDKVNAETGEALAEADDELDSGKEAERQSIRDGALSFVQKTAKRDIADDMGVEFMVDNAEDADVEEDSEERDAEEDAQQDVEQDDEVEQDDSQDVDADADEDAEQDVDADAEQDGEEVQDDAEVQDAAEEDASETVEEEEPEFNDERPEMEDDESA
jgi:hypothetical protein